MKLNGNTSKRSAAAKREAADFAAQERSAHRSASARSAQSEAAARRAAHSITNHTDGMASALADQIRVLIFLTNQADIRHTPNLHPCSPFFSSSIALRRSWPQEASISPPKLRRTVAVIPCASSCF